MAEDPRPDGIGFSKRGAVKQIAIIEPEPAPEPEPEPPKTEGKPKTEESGS